MNRVGWVWNRDKEWKWEGEEYVFFLVLVCVVFFIFLVFGRGGVGWMCLDGCDGVCGLWVFLGVGFLFGYFRLGCGCFCVVFF